jgi:hypothetical protein
LLLTAGMAIVLAVGFDLNAIASIGSAIALMVFALISGAHIRVRGETGASLPMLLLAVVSTVTVLVAFTLTTLVDEPKTLVAMVVIVALSIVADLLWKRSRGGTGTTIDLSGIDVRATTTGPTDVASPSPWP